MTVPKVPALADLRRDIDRIDEAMHRLLMERGDIIQTLIRVKGTGESGQAFRPGREAEMMRRLAERHHGLLPLDTAESIWRVIIATFTFVQANYTVHVDISGGDSPIRDSARFHFGFTPPLLSYAGPDRVIAAIARSAGDLGLIRAEDHVSAGAWWRALEAPESPKIIARLPFIERRDHPAGLPVFVLARPLKDAAVREAVMFSVAAPPAAIAASGGHILETAADFNGDESHLVAVKGEKAAAFDASFDSSAFEIGSHAERYQALMSQQKK
jgi:chorismate mutase